MSNLLRPDETQTRPQRLVMGGLIGALFGLLAAYFYSRAAEDDVRVNGASRQRASTGEVIGLGLAALALLRQISEMGRSPARKK